MTNDSRLAKLPSVDKLLSEENCRKLADEYGHQITTNAIRSVLDDIRRTCRDNGASIPTKEEILERIQVVIAASTNASLKPVINLTGTVLHTNLGRASLPAEAIDAMVQVAGTSNLEYELESAERGDRDRHIESLLTALTGAEAATVVNNNAAAILLTLNTLALNREVPASRGELVEIGGSFRIPDIMERAGCKLVETGTTNRTHLRDYERAITERTALLMKVHTSNYAIEGFTQSVSEFDAAELAHKNGLPLVSDLGSGTLVDLTRFGLPREPTVTSIIEAGADVVTFSGDKLLGGPQAGLIVGKKQYIDAIKSNPMKRALRVDKTTLAALAAVLALYRNPDTLAERLPTLKWLTRSSDEIMRTAEKVLPAMASALDGVGSARIENTNSQIGSGSLPVDLLPSVAISVTPEPGDGADSRLRRIAAAFRELDKPVIGRIHDGTLIFDLRTLDNPSLLTDQLAQLKTRLHPSDH